MGQTIIRVIGVPVPKGSTRSFKAANSDRIVTKNANSQALGPWMSAIAAEVEKVVTCTTGPLMIGMTFNLPRPKSMRGNTDPPHVVKPDVDKLERAVLDALTGIAYRDDSQVVGISSRKRYASEFTGEAPGVTLVITDVEWKPRR